jgi:uncharacterized protein (UPF0128 family)
MKEFTFTAYCTFGKGDSGESWIDVELSDEESERLEKYGTQPDIYYNEFYRCEELKDLYNKIYAIAINQMTEEMRDFGDLEEKYANDPNFKVDDLYPCGVNFPFEFEDMLVEDE